MAVISDYSSLTQAVIDVAEDDSAEFAVYIPTAIDLAEVRLSREMDTLGLVHVATVTAQSTSRLLTKPTGYKNGQDLIYVNASTGEQTVMKKRTYSFIVDYWPISTSVGHPKYYADVDVSTFMIAPTADASIAMTLRYEGRPSALTSANPSNYFTEQCSDALFYATLTEMMKFARNSTMQQLYEQEYQNARDTIINEAKRQRRDNSGTPNNPSTNTIQGGV